MYTSPNYVFSSSSSSVVVDLYKLSDLECCYNLVSSSYIYYILSVTIRIKLLRM